MKFISHTSIIIALVILSAFFISKSGFAKPVFNDEKAGFSLKFKDVENPYKVMALFVLPSEEIVLKVAEVNKNDKYNIEFTSGILKKDNVNSWVIKMPDKPGLCSIKINKGNSSERMDLNVFVMVPYSQIKDGAINGYYLASYPQKVFKGLPIYGLPKGFVEVTKQNETTLVAPHFTLKQFLCKQVSDYPKYLVLSENLLLTLELILQKTNEAGYYAGTLKIMSGYRTPFYNKAIGNIKYSMHLWGSAADIYIDEFPQDNNMDDLNRDGKIDYSDANVLYKIIEKVFSNPMYSRFIGGLGIYNKTHQHGPFVHVDVRGYLARWGS